MEHQAGEGDEVHARHGRGQALVVARQGGRSLGSIRQGVPVRTIQRYPLNNSRKG